MIIVFSFVGCVSLFKSDEDSNRNQQLIYPKKLEQAQDDFVAGRTVDAISKINQFLNDATNLHWYGHAYFLKAYFYEVEGKSTLAIKHYREAVEHGLQYEGEVEAKALYNLSFIYEREGEMQKMLATLVDLTKRQKYFPPFTTRVETPSRMAAVYASLGRTELAIQIHDNAEKEYNQLIQKNSVPETRNEHSQLLYYLALSSFDEPEESVENLLAKLRKGQKYYLYCAEASSGPWAQKCYDRINELYNKAWAHVLNYEPEGLSHDPLAHKRSKSEKQLDLASQIYDLLFQLRVEEFPLTNVNKKSTKIMNLTSEWIEKIEKFAIQIDLGPAMVRNKKIKNRKLIRYVEEKQQPVLINKESNRSLKKAPPAPLTDNSEGSPLPEKQKEESIIGNDPNL